MAPPKLPAGTPATWEGNQDERQATHSDKQLNAVGKTRRELKNLALPLHGTSVPHHIPTKHTTEKYGKLVKRQRDHEQRLDVVHPSEQNFEWSQLADNRNTHQTNLGHL